MNTPQIEIELDGQRQPLPGQLKRVTVEDDWEWYLTHDGRHGLHRRGRDVRIEVWAGRAETQQLVRFAEQSRPRLWLTPPGGRAVAVLVTDSRHIFGDGGNRIELRGQTPGLELAEEAAHA